MADFKPGDRVSILDGSNLHGRIAVVSDDRVNVFKPRKGIVYVQVNDFHLPFSDHELRPAFQACKDCRGRGSWSDMDMDFICPTCDGTGTIHRTGPYRLADGTWSDGVDRSKRVNTRAFGETNPERIRVVCQRTLPGQWKPESMPFQGEIPISWDDFTHAEAIAYADHHARTTKNGDAP